MERVQARSTLERHPADVFFSLGDGEGDADHGTVLELHYEVTIEHWVRDDRRRHGRLRWFVWDWLGIGAPPLRAETATADEVTTVTGPEAVPIVHNLPYRRLVKVVRRDGPGVGAAPPQGRTVGRGV